MATDIRVGVLCNGKFVCLDCNKLTSRPDVNVPVFEVNIAPYSQYCCMCGERVVQGRVSTNLFD